LDSVLIFETRLRVSAVLRRENRKPKLGRTIRVFAVAPMYSANYKTVRSALDCFLAAA
jgi:hypothetical protein